MKRLLDKVQVQDSFGLLTSLHSPLLCPNAGNSKYGNGLDVSMM